jgi:hypothetical protein
MADPFELVSTFRRPSRGHAATRQKSSGEDSTGPESRAIEPGLRTAPAGLTGTGRGARDSRARRAHTPATHAPAALIRSHAARYRQRGGDLPGAVLIRAPIAHYRAKGCFRRPVRRRTRKRPAVGGVMRASCAYERNSKPEIDPTGARSQRRTFTPRNGKATLYVAVSRSTRRRDVAESPMTRIRATCRHAHPRSSAISRAKRTFRSIP